MILNKYLVVVMIFVGAATLAYAEDLVPETVSHCSSEIGKAENLIQTQGADQVSAAIASSAAKACEIEFSNRELNYFKQLSGSCDSSFRNLEGTASKAMHSICNMNAARFIMGLQLPTGI